MSAKIQTLPAGNRIGQAWWALVAALILAIALTIGVLISTRSAETPAVKESVTTTTAYTTDHGYKTRFTDLARKTPTLPDAIVSEENARIMGTSFCRQCA